MTIIISKETTYLPSPNKNMKVLTIYLLSLVFFASVGQHLASNIKESLQDRTESILFVLSWRFSFMLVAICCPTLAKKTKDSK